MLFGPTKRSLYYGRLQRMSHPPPIDTPLTLQRRDGLLSVLKGTGLASCGLVGLWISLEWFAFRLASKLNLIFGAGVLFGFGMIGLGVFRAVFLGRMPRIAKAVAVVSAFVGLGISVAVLEIVLSEPPW